MNAYIKSWLQQFGHIGVMSRDLSEAVASAQKFLGVEPTGQICRATERQMLAPRCGCRDVRDMSLLHGLADLSAVNKWPTNQINYAFADFLPESLISKPDQLAITRDNWDIVSSVCGLQATLVDDVNNAHIVYNTGRGPRGGFDSPAVLGYTYEPVGITDPSYRNMGQNAAAGQVVFDLDEEWTKNKKDARRIPYASVNWHEACGHGSGLGHVPPQAQPNMMEAVLNRDAVSPGPWDISQLVLRYGPPAAATPPKPPVGTPTNPTLPSPPATSPPAASPGVMFKIKEADGHVRVFNATELFS